MTLEQLLECTAAEFRSYTDEQLLEFFKPVLSVTRPSLALQEQQKDNKANTGGQSTRQVKRGPSPGSDKAKALEIAKKLGIDLGFK
jgi:hypothetical protein